MACLSLLIRHSLGSTCPLEEIPLPFLRAHTAVLCGDYFIHSSSFLIHSLYVGYQVVALFLDFSYSIFSPSGADYELVSKSHSTLGIFSLVFLHIFLLAK